MRQLLRAWHTWRMLQAMRRALHHAEKMAWHQGDVNGAMDAGVMRQELERMIQGGDDG